MYHLSIARVANSESELTIAQLAERTGLSAGTLRMWESRHGFPGPARLPGGHRRYSEADSDQVREVMRLRDHGLSLPAAIERARSQRTPPAVSVFAGLRRRRPDVAATVLPKPAVLALSRAIEDEYCAQAADGVVIGAFQRERFYRHAEHRWRDLARTAQLAVALADFNARADPADGPVEVPIGPRHPLSREWAVLINAEGVRACLAAWEQPREKEVPDSQRRFEVLWSFEPSVVSDAMAVAAELLSPIDADLGARVRSTLQTGAVDFDPSPALRYGGALAHRMVGYLGRMLLTPGEASRRVQP